MAIYWDTSAMGFLASLFRYKVLMERNAWYFAVPGSPHVRQQGSLICEKALLLRTVSAISETKWTAFVKWA